MLGLGQKSAWEGGSTEAQPEAVGKASKAALLASLEDPGPPGPYSSYPALACGQEAGGRILTRSHCE